MSKPETILQLSPDQLIELEGWNVRLADDPDNLAHIEQLAESIFHVGVLEPLTAYHATRAGEYVVTNGHCRLEAVRQAIARGAPIKSVPVRLEPKTASEADHTFSMIARNSGKNLSPLELGIACKRLLPFGWTLEDLAAKTGYGIQQIRNVVQLANAGAEVTKLVETGQIAATLAVQAIQAEGPAQAAETLKEAVKVAKAEDAAKPAGKRGRPPGKAAAPVKATMKHVKTVKAKNGVTLAAMTGKGKKAPAQPELSTMVSDEKALEMLVGAANPLKVFDEQFGKRRDKIFNRLVNGAKPAAQGNGRDPHLDTLALIFGRAAVDVADADGILTLVMSADDWESACRVLKIKAPETADTL